MYRTVTPAEASSVGAARAALDGVASKKVPCTLEEVVKFLKPFKARLEKVAVESTYNWYWLVDGLQFLKYPVVLANPAAMQP